MKTIIHFCLFTFLPFYLFADSIVEKPQKLFFNGYLNELYIPSYSFSAKDFNQSGMIHNRLNLKYKPTNNWELAAELRTRALVQDFRGYTKEQFKQVTHDAGWLNLSWNLATSKYLVLTTSIERLYASYQTDKWGVKLGRQRINWAQSLMFNPNDIFNSYSFFDYDYPEMQGSDAIRLSYYPTTTSAVEVAAKLNYYGKLTAAGLYRTNVKNWDIQFLSGVVNSEDFMIGTGLSGDIKGVNLRGEFSYYYTFTKNAKLKNTYVATLGLDYIFSNSIMISFTGLYNRLPENYTSNFYYLFSVPSSPKYLAVTEWTATAQISYPFSPILNGSFAAICFITLPAFYIGPSIDWSITKDLSLSSMVQYFIGNKKMQPQDVMMGYARLKWNFGVRSKEYGVRSKE